VWPEWATFYYFLRNNFQLEDQGSMLWSQFSYIFRNFRRKKWRLSQKPILCDISRKN
jgi:hypothetical protein